MELAGHKCVGFCEFDKNAVASYVSMHCITEEQRKYLATLDFKKRQKEILKEEYRNGEWYCNDIRQVTGANIPRADCWGFGAPCQDFSIAGVRKGLAGDRSSLIREVFRVVSEIPAADRPKYLIYENVKGMLSSNGGWDYAAILFEMAGLGYDIEWQNCNSKDFGVPQNRERIYTIGRLRDRCTKKVFSFGRSNEKDNLERINQVGFQSSENRDNVNQYRVYDSNGIAPCLNTAEGGGREPHVVVPTKFGIDYNMGGRA